MPQLIPVIGAIGAIAGTVSTISSLAKGKKQQQNSGGVGLDTTMTGMEPLSTQDYNAAPQLPQLAPPQNLGNFAGQLQAPELLNVMSQFRS